MTHFLASLESKEFDSKCITGYTSCPLLTDENKVLLAEFKYKGELEETFRKWIGRGLEGAKESVRSRRFFSVGVLEASC